MLRTPLGLALRLLTVSVLSVGCVAEGREAPAAPVTATSKTALVAKSCTNLPAPPSLTKCQTDAECRVVGVLPAACVESKCVSGLCQFRPPFTSLCKCVPGTVQVCTLSSGSRGIQTCSSSTIWGACTVACPDC